VTGAIGTGIVDTPFTSTVVDFTVNAGSSPFDIGDAYTLYMWQLIATRSNQIAMTPVNLCLNEATEFPPGYTNFIVWGLAEFMAPEYSMPAPPDVVRHATYYKRLLKTRNMKPGELIIDRALQSRARRRTTFYSSP
jgi:hypothetical protein